jgi:hypothetical protein
MAHEIFSLTLITNPAKQAGGRDRDVPGEKVASHYVCWSSPPMSQEPTEQGAFIVVSQHHRSHESVLCLLNAVVRCTVFISLSLW